MFCLNLKCSKFVCNYSDRNNTKNFILLLRQRFFSAASSIQREYDPIETLYREHRFHLPIRSTVWSFKGKLLLLCILTESLLHAVLLAPTIRFNFYGYIQSSVTVRKPGNYFQKLNIQYSKECTHPPIIHNIHIISYNCMYFSFLPYTFKHFFFHLTDVIFNIE